MNEEFPIINNSEQEEGIHQNEEDVVAKEFAQIINSTACPFAPKSKMEFSDKWDEGKSFDENIDTLAIRLKEFTNTCESREMDGFIMEVTGKDSPTDIESLAKLLKKTLTNLESRDEKSDKALEKDILDPSWQFTFNGSRLFIITFAPFYPESSPRHSPRKDGTFIFFQPESSFHLHIPHPESDPRTVNLKVKIRDAFKKQGRPYDESIVNSKSDSLKYIKPLNIGDPVVKWWEY